MNFAEFTYKYRDTMNPATGKPWSQGQIVSDSKVDESLVTSWLQFHYDVQREMVASSNRMPTNKDVIDKWYAVHPNDPKPVDPIPAKSTVGTHKPPAKMVRDMSVEELTKLIDDCLRRAG